MKFMPDRMVGSKRTLLALLGVVALFAGTVCAADSTPPVKQTGPDRFMVGQVELNKRRRTVTFSAELNMNAGAIEYLIVTRAGKTHESLLSTGVEPYHIHLAMLLLNARGAAGRPFPENPAKPLPGEPVELELSWWQNGKEKRRHAGQLVRNEQTGGAMTRGAWTYTGSHIMEGTFVAQRDGSIVSVMLDPDALINNPRAGRENDKIWRINTNGLPPLQTPVQVTIRLLAPAAQR